MLSSGAQRNVFLSPPHASPRTGRNERAQRAIAPLPKLRFPASAPPAGWGGVADTYRAERGRRRWRRQGRAGCSVAGWCLTFRFVLGRAWVRSLCEEGDCRPGAARTAPRPGGAGSRPGEHPLGSVCCPASGRVCPSDCGALVGSCGCGTGNL